MNENFTQIFQAVRSPAEGQPQHFFAIIAYAPPEISAAVDDIRSRYDPAFKDGIPPHITIKRPAILTNPALLSAMSGAIRVGLQHLQPFQVELDGYGVFRHPGRNVVFIKVRDERSFCELHTSVAAALSSVLADPGLDQYENSAYHPHLTIGNALSDLELAVMEHELSGGSYRLNFSFTLSEIALFSQPPAQPWQTVDRLVLGQGS